MEALKGRGGEKRRGSCIIKNKQTNKLFGLKEENRRKKNEVNMMAYRVAQQKKLTMLNLSSTM